LARHRGDSVVLEFWTGDAPISRSLYLAPYPNLIDGIPSLILDSADLGVDCGIIDLSKAKQAYRAHDESSAKAAGFAAHILQLAPFFALGGGAAAQERTLISSTTESLPVQSDNSNYREGDLLHEIRTNDFINLGFRYAPWVYTAAAVSTNPSTAAFDEGTQIDTNGTVSVGTPWRLSATGRWASGDGWALSAGYYLRVLSEERDVLYDNGKTISGDTTTHEHAFLLAISRALTRRLAVAVSAKGLLQAIPVPTGVSRETDTYGVNNTTETLVTDRLSTGHRVYFSPDFGLSTTYDILANVRIGAAFQNILGTPERYRGALSSDRVFGAGGSVVLWRLRVGSDLEFSDRHSLNTTHGVSLFLGWVAEIGGGYVTGEGILRMWARLGAVMLSMARDAGGSLRLNVGGHINF
jgi:hypothetical protein